MTSNAELAARYRRALAKDLLRRGLRVQSRARELLSGADGHIKRVNTGDLRSSITVTPTTYAGEPAVRVGTRKRYARWVHDGTGIYGPLRRKIVPRQARALVFSSKAYGMKSGKFRGKVVVRSVKGIRPNPFLRDALRAARN